jgi:transcriptional regulator with XRE-family HTH domain
MGCCCLYVFVKSVCLSLQMDLHPNYISSVERAERNISLKNIERIAFALGVEMSALVAVD